MPVHHIGINVSDVDKSRDFYLAALKPLGYKVLMNIWDGKVLGLGTWCGPDFWLASLDSTSADGSETRNDPKAPPPTSGPVRKPTGPMHIAFAAPNRKKVREFHEAAM